ncbi:MAG TPA: S41 family peptidase [Anaerolineales bacterium]|nr:S41 family peptidase [Anaerolineales bacterium]
MKKVASIFSLFTVVAVLLSSCVFLPLAATTSTPATASGNEPYEITGKFSVTNGFVFQNYFVENSVALVDMHGFVVRDPYWVLPVDSQVLGYMTMDLNTLNGTFQLSLPERPLGVLNDVNPQSKTDKGVQIFTVAYWPNLAGGPFAVGDDQSWGWPNYLTSVVTDATNQYEVTGGKLVVWSPDGNQKFPTGFGADGKLFTADDPVASIPAGYTIVDLDQKPFAFEKQAQPTMTLYEPKDFALKDFSKDSYTAAFDNLFNFVKTNYAFNGYPDIQPNWDQLYAQIQPRIQQAQNNNDANAFWLALRDFTWAFKDGHVGMSSSDYGDQLFTTANAGGYGFAIRELDDGSVAVIYVLGKGPADLAGMKVGAVVTQFNGKPIKDAIGAVVPWTLPMSSAWDLRYQQARYLLRSPLGTDATVTFANPGEAPKTVKLTSVAERDSFSRTSRYYGVDTQPTLPVDYSILPSGIGYVRVNSYDDDLNLTIRLFQRAMDLFTNSKVPGIIIDLRYNSGGNPIGLAAFLSDQKLTMPQGYSYSPTTGKFEKNGVPGLLLPNVEQYRFDKMMLLVSPACASACEDEAYSFSKVPGMVVVGMDPTSGTMADVGDGQVAMPDGISMQFPTQRFLLADGSLFLQGQGVQPTLRVPVTLANATATTDVVLQTAEDAILGTGSSTGGATPTASTGPRMMSASELQKILGSNPRQLESAANETYPSSAFLKVPATFTYTISLTKSEPLIWSWGWCAKDQATLTDNLSKMKVTFKLDGQEVPASDFQTDDTPQGGQACHSLYGAITDWATGANQVQTTVTFTVPLNDGTYDYPAGDQVMNYTVTVQP